MKLYNGFDNYNSFYVCGDIHGEFKTLMYELKRKRITNAVILLAGDCGIGFEKPTYYEQLYKKLDITLSKQNCQLLLLRGNHDDPAYFENQLIDFPRMKSIPDYSIVCFHDLTILCVGGATSVDRSERLHAMWKANLKKRSIPTCYWENEAPIFNENDLAEIKSNKISINTVVTHTAPSFCKPINKSGVEYWMAKDEKLSEELTMERNTMTQIYDRLLLDGHPLANWFYGHFHDSCTEYISGVRFKMFNIMEICEITFSGSQLRIPADKSNDYE